MAYLIKVEKLFEDETLVEYSYAGSGGGGGSGRFKINKVSGEITISDETGDVPLDKYAQRGIWAVLKRWEEDGVYPQQAQWAS